jgi:hypothetical protein
LYRGIVHGKPIVLKKLAEGEYGGYEKVCTFTPEVMKNHHLVPCVAFEACSPPSSPSTVEMSALVESSTLKNGVERTRDVLSNSI